MEHKSSLPHTPDLMADAGAFYTKALRDLAQDTKANEGICRDWTIIRLWLGDCEDELSADHLAEIGKAWRAYMAIGLAPSHKLQHVFDAAHELYKSTDLKRDRPPVEIMDVFDRMLATDDQISTKRADDTVVERAKFAKTIAELRGPAKQGWWSRQSRSLRGWIFVSVAWAAIALFILTVFDPLDVRRWHWAEGRDYLKAMAIIFFPMIVGLLKTAYFKAVQ